MVASPQFCISFSGITIRFLLPTPADLPEELSAFLCDDPGDVDAEYEICLIREPLCPGTPLIHVERGIEFYKTKEGWLRIYTPLIEEDGCQVACLLCSDSRNKLFYPASRWDFYASRLSCIHLIGIEVLLLQHDALLLHSSVVRLKDKAVLFSGPSGAGKSTQAALWQQYLGAEIINGDRCVISKRPDGFYGGGSPWSGTSRIYHRAQAPIAGIFLVHQSPENSVQRLGITAFPALFSQTVINSWDSPFMDRMTALFADLMAQVPVYRLNCRPDQDAVMTAFQTLF